MRERRWRLGLSCGDVLSLEVLLDLFRAWSFVCTRSYDAFQKRACLLLVIAIYIEFMYLSCSWSYTQLEIPTRTCLTTDCKKETMSMRCGRRKARFMFACARLCGTRMAPEWRRSQLDLHARVGFTFTTSTFRFKQLQLSPLPSTLQFLHNGSQKQVLGPPTDLQ